MCFCFVFGYVCELFSELVGFLFGCYCSVVFEGYCVVCYGCSMMAGICLSIESPSSLPGDNRSVRPVQSSALSYKLMREYKRFMMIKLIHRHTRFVKIQVIHDDTRYS